MKADEPDFSDLIPQTDSAPLGSAVDTPASLQSTGGSDDRSASCGSRRSSKRKATVEDDDYIANNPELYGLRRSVCISIYGSYLALTFRHRLVTATLVKLYVETPNFLHDDVY